MWATGLAARRRRAQRPGCRSKPQCRLLRPSQLRPRTGSCTSDRQVSPTRLVPVRRPVLGVHRSGHLPHGEPDQTGRRAFECCSGSGYFPGLSLSDDPALLEALYVIEKCGPILQQNHARLKGWRVCVPIDPDCSVSARASRCTTRAVP